VVLVAVLIVTALVAVIAAGLMFRMQADVAASAASARGEQAYEAAMSGVARAMAVLRASAGDPTLWYDNPDILMNQLVADDGANQWYFTVYAPEPSQPNTLRYGLTDEAGKMNVNSATAEMLAALPNMTAELVDCLLDYRDANSDTLQDGAEQDYYDHLELPYLIPNAPLSTLEELFLVKGFTGQVVYGEDFNDNGLLDPNEDDGDESFPPDNHDGRLDRGLRALATVFSTERNVDRSGRARVNINADSSSSQVSGVSERTAEFIRLCRDDGYTFKHPSELLEMKYPLKSNPKNPPKSQPSLKAGATIESGVGGGELAAVLDRLTTVQAASRKVLPGLINANTAPAEVLAALPGMDPNLAQQVIDARRNLDPGTLASPAWLFTQNLLDAQAFKTVAPYITARSFQYSVRCVGFGVPCGRYRVVEAVLDVSAKTPRLVYVRDITRLGLPFAVDVGATERSR
jgi:type II secretory pathway component PulK